MELSEKIVYLRKSKGWSQEQMANKLEVSRQAVYKWEAGISQPEIDKLKKLAKIFDVSFNELLDDDIDITKVCEAAQEPSLPQEGEAEKTQIGVLPDISEPIDEPVQAELLEEPSPSEELSEPMCKGDSTYVIEPQSEKELDNNDKEEKNEPNGAKRKRLLIIALFASIAVTVILVGLLSFFAIRYLLNNVNYPQDSGITQSSNDNNDNTGNSSSVDNTTGSSDQNGNKEDGKTYFTVSFVTGGGTPIDDIRVESGCIIAQELITVKQGYALVGWVNMATYEEWDFQRDTVEGNLVLYAVWMKESYITVTYDKNDGTGKTEQRQADPRYAIRVEDPYSTPDSFIIGWSTTPTGQVEYRVGDEAYFEEDITLYAVWANESTVSVTYHKNDGSGDVYREYLSKGTMLSLISPYNNRHLLGWSTTPDGAIEYGVGASVAVNTSKTFYAVWTDKDGFYFVKTGTNTCSLYAYTGTYSAVAIPEMYNDYYVTGIEDFAFTIQGGYNDTLKALYLPSSIYEIGENTLYGLRGLVELGIPESVNSIHAKAFLSFACIQNFKVSDSNISYSSVDGVLYNKEKTNLIKYPVGRADTVYYVPQGTHIIGENSFFGSDLEEIYFPSGVGVIRISAFEGCTSLRTIDLGDRIDYVEGRAFYDCHSLEAIELTYDLIAIGKEAFYNCWELTDVKIHGDVGEISYRTFGNCYKLKCIEVGGSITKIDDNAFEGSTLFEGIEYTLFA